MTLLAIISVTIISTLTAADSAAPCDGKIYSVQANDTCDTIAKAHGATIGDIVVINQDICGGDNQNLLPVSSVLCIIPGASAACGPVIPADQLNAKAYLAQNQCSSNTVALVNAGTSCSEIAAAFGISLEQFKALSSFTPGQCDDLEAADTICVPASGYIGANGECGSISRLPQAETTVSDTKKSLAAPPEIATTTATTTTTSATVKAAESAFIFNSKASPRVPQAVMGVLIATLANFL